jgi:hypothetical protein
MRPRKHPSIRDGGLGGQRKEFFTNLAEDRLENLKNSENQPIGIKNLIAHEARFETDDKDSVHVRTNVTFLAPIRPHRFEARHTTDADPLCSRDATLDSLKRKLFTAV